MPNPQFAEKQEKSHANIVNHGKIMQGTFYMACMGPFMVLGYGCQERSTLEFNGREDIF